MKQRFINYLYDPVDQTIVIVGKIFKKSGEEIIEALIISKNSWYSVIGGIPRILASELKCDLL